MFKIYVYRRYSDSIEKRNSTHYKYYHIIVPSSMLEIESGFSIL